MPVVTYNRLKTAFPSGEAHAGQLITEIESGSLKAKFNNVRVNDSDVDFMFILSLTADEEQELDAIVAAHMTPVDVEVHGQGMHHMLGDMNTTLTVDELAQGIHVCNPTEDRVVTLPPAADTVRRMCMRVSECYDFDIVNLSTTSKLTVSTTSTIGNMDVDPGVSAIFRIRVTNNTPSSEAFTLYRRC